LVAPVLDEGARSRVVALPPGLWYPLDGSEPVEGGTDIDVAAPVDHTPVFVRAGAVLPMDETGELTLHVYAPAEDRTGGGILYQDAGDGYGEWRDDRLEDFRSGDGHRPGAANHGAFPALPVYTRDHGAAGLIGSRCFS